MHHVYVGYVSGVRDGAPGLGNVVLPEVPTDSGTSTALYTNNNYSRSKGGGKKEKTREKTKIVDTGETSRIVKHAAVESKK